MLEKGYPRFPDPAPKNSEKYCLDQTLIGSFPALLPHGDEKVSRSSPVWDTSATKAQTKTLPHTPPKTNKQKKQTRNDKLGIILEMVFFLALIFVAFVMFRSLFGSGPPFTTETKPKSERNYKSIPTELQNHIKNNSLSLFNLCICKL